jgi:hypothetical protein
MTPRQPLLVMLLLLLLLRRNSQPGVKKPVVFLQHGITLASDCFTVFGANESLAYILADAGVGCWVNNCNSSSSMHSANEITAETNCSLPPVGF